MQSLKLYSQFHSNLFDFDFSLESLGALKLQREIWSGENVSYSDKNFPDSFKVINSFAFRFFSIVTEIFKLQIVRSVYLFQGCAYI